MHELCCSKPTSNCLHLYFNTISMAIYTCNMISFLYYFHIKGDWWVLKNQLNLFFIYKLYLLIIFN